MNICGAVLVVACVAVAHSSGLGKPLPFEINLDDPPEQRWAAVATAYKDVLPAICLALDESIAAAKIWNDVQQRFLRHSNIPAEYIAELSGIVKTVGHPSFTLDRLMFFQMMYEMALPRSGGSCLVQKASSGIIAADANGTVLHGRNFDAQLFFVARGRAMSLEDVTLELTWKRNGTVLFTSVNVVGQIGVHTGMTSGASPWSVQQSSRDAGVVLKLQDRRLKNADALEAGGKLHMTYLRGLLESQSNFKDAVLRLERSPMCAEQYFVLAGSRPWDGAVIVCDRTAHPDSLNNVQVLSQEIGRWFLLQTVEDIWSESEDRRRPEAVELVSSLGQPRMNAKSLVTSMRTYPMFAFDTVFTWVASPASGETHVFMGSERVDDDAAGLPTGGGSFVRRLRG